MLRIISLAFAMILLIAGRVAAQQFSPSISVNGASGGTTVTATASMSVAVTNGPGNATDWIGVCNAGVPTSPTQCDYAGYSWDYLNCTQTTPATGVTSATCSLSAPSVAGNYYVGFFSNNTYNVLASAPFGVTVPSPSSPSITVNGSSSGTTVSAGASMSVRVANGPGNRADWIGVCNAGVPTSPTQCDYAGYSWDYLNCTQTYPSTGSTSGSCSLAAPGRGGNYIVGFFSNDTYTVLASAPFTISGGGGGSGGPNVVQSPSTTSNPGTGTCTWAISQAIASGDTVIGFGHFSANNDTAEAYPTSVTDNVGNTYTLSAGVHWQPYPEDIGMWYLTGVQGNPTAFTFHFASSSTPYHCNVGLVEYSGVNRINALAGPVANASSPDPSITISPTATSLIWAFGAPNPISSCSNSGQQGSIENSGYSILIDNCAIDGLAVWGSNATVSAGSLTLTWNNHDYWNASVCADGTHTTTGCSTVMMAAAIN